MVALVFFGFFPSPLLDVANPFTDGLLAHVGVEDDAPDIPPGPHSYASETEGDH